MTEKRKHPRFNCKIPVKFKYYEGDPEEIDNKISIPLKGKGHILDISRGGVFIVTNSNIYINMPIRLKFKKNKKKFAIDGIIVRTGIIQNNPSEIAQSLSDYSGKGDKYLAVRFNTEIEDIAE